MGAYQLHEARMGACQGSSLLVFKLHCSCRFISLISVCSIKLLSATQLRSLLSLLSHLDLIARPRIRWAFPPSTILDNQFTCGNTDSHRQDAFHAVRVGLLVPRSTFSILTSLGNSAVHGISSVCTVRTQRGPARVADSLAVVRTRGLVFVRPEKSWRPIVTISVVQGKDEHGPSHEVALGCDGQNPNLKSVIPV